MSAGLFGFLGYEMMNFDKKVCNLFKNDLNIPQSILFRPSIIIIIDNVKGEIIVINPIWINSSKINLGEKKILYFQSNYIDVFIDQDRNFKNENKPFQYCKCT